ncbi:hypothetical protein B566_EDAN014378 [Ephemera danica]|nr:hypothetical protein B566_EDAN014378 [Ephemera danica]
MDQASCISAIATILILSLTRDPRIGDRLVTYIQDRRNKMLERWKIRRQKRVNKTAAANNKAGNKTDRLQALMEEDEDYDYDEDYPDYDFSPTSIFIFVLELFGGLIGLTWGAIATIWNAG